MFDLIIRNINIATMAEDAGPYGTVADGLIATQNGRLAYVGIASEFKGGNARKDIDGNGMWALPGFLDCHTHIVYGGNRAREFEERLNGVSYEEIARRGGGIISTVTATRQASEEELAASALKRLKRLKLEGVTTVEVKSGYGLTTDDEVKMLRAAKAAGDAAGMDIRTTFLGAHALPPEFENNADGYIDLVCDEMIPFITKEKLADTVDAFCENIAFTPAQTTRVFEAAKAHGLDVKLHADQLSNLSGAALSAKFGGLSADHLEHTDDAGARAMAEAGTAAVLLPGAFYVLKETKLPPVDLFRKHGVPIALATDANPGSSPVLSLQLMLHMACTFFGLTPEEALKGITLNAAKALGLGNDRGSLEVGKRADINLFDISEPAELVYYVGGVLPSKTISVS
ncbi:imidazolonepropionase [Kordiimonas sp.]|uniref:imidazolonepropionase n=1 Tax=Kordiimonas sp. TaxID=1970157 RepID=UPI003A8E2B5D